ncbi:Heterokaryon incompatibility protein 6, OR allele [Colletotrichum tropicale]|nr:Heterokaryon incompatibility protein 6, OR allele [Colletotrichum tropicale]
MSTVEGYSFYDGLPVVGKWTRILLLEPGAYDDPVSCSLYLTPFQSAEYEAISYVWGSTQDTGSIVCQGLEIDVTANLVQSLRQVRYADQPRHLWVDALCINQRDLHEKAFHVNMMGEIYSHAWRVIIYLGDDGHNGEAATIAFDVIRDYNRLAAKYMTESRIADGSGWKPADDEGGYGLITGERLLPAVQIFKKPWFGRVWVLQEVGLAREVLTAYGNSVINFTEIIDFAKAWSQTGNDFTGVYFSSGYISLLFNHIWATYAQSVDRSWYRSSFILTTSARQVMRENKPEFEDVLFKAKQIQKATDPRDFVYAFLGHPLAKSDNGELLVEANYERTMSELRLLLFSRLSERSLRFLGLTWHKTSVYIIDTVFLCGSIAGGEPSLDDSAKAEDADAHRLATEAALLNRPSIAEEYWALLEATERSQSLAYADKALAFASTLLHACDADDKDPASIARSFSDFCKEHCPTIQNRLEKYKWLNQWASAKTHFIPFVPRTASSIKGEKFFTTKKGYWYWNKYPIGQARRFDMHHSICPDTPGDKAR